MSLSKLRSPAGATVDMGATVAAGDPPRALPDIAPPPDVVLPDIPAGTSFTLWSCRDQQDHHPQQRD